MLSKPGVPPTMDTAGFFYENFIEKLYNKYKPIYNNE
jgi:hypothetical protein